MKRLLVSLTATLLLIGIVVGVPWLLLWWGRLVDLPSSLRVQNWLRPDDGTLTTGLPLFIRTSPIQMNPQPKALQVQSQ